MAAGFCVPLPMKKDAQTKEKTMFNQIPSGLGRNRTCDPTYYEVVLYQLSYQTNFGKGRIPYLHDFFKVFVSLSVAVKGN